MKHLRYSNYYLKVGIRPVSSSTQEIASPKWGIEVAKSEIRRYHNEHNYFGSVMAYGCI